jgi:diguanylate cyclase (GGDEF)-like protein
VKTRSRRLLSLILTAAVALPLAAGLIVARYDLAADAEHQRAHAAADQFASTVTDAVAQGLAMANSAAAAGDHTPIVANNAKSGGAAPAWRPWTLANGRLEFSGRQDDAPPPEALSRELLSRPTVTGVPVLVGPIAVADGGDVVAVAVRRSVGPQASAWVGATISVQQLLEMCGVRELLHRGYGVELADLATQGRIFASDYAKLVDPVTAQVRVAGAGWRLSLAPRAGWGEPSRIYPAALLAALLALAWMFYDVGRSGAIDAAQSEQRLSEERRVELNLHYESAIDRLLASESRLTLLGNHDPTTGLANRSAFLDQLAKSFEMIRHRGEGNLCVTVIGFDHFAEISNSYGHDTWSRLLGLAAERIEEALTPQPAVARVGEAELALAVAEGTTIDHARLAAQLRAPFGSPLPLEDQTFLLRPFIGFADAASAYEAPGTTLDHAATAMVGARRDEASAYQVFAARHVDEMVHRVRLEADLDIALSEDELELFYEPIVEGALGGIVGFEALLRWKHPTQGFIPPVHFLPIAHEAGMTDRLDDWVMRHAAMQLAAWDRAGYHAFLHFNLTASAFRRTNLAETIGNVLQEFRLPPRRLRIEMTESAVIADVRGAARQLERLQQFGVDAWLDDFGTGYSALSYLRALPLQGVKLDRSFLERIAVDAKDFGFLKSVIQLISYLGMQCIVEGVETRDQEDLLSLTPCTLFQGYLYSRAVPAADALRLLAAATPSRETALAS